VCVCVRMHDEQDLMAGVAVAVTKEEDVYRVIFICIFMFVRVCVVMNAK